MNNYYIALIRGINVGPSKRVAMADLKKLIESIGGSAVKTILNSGNAVFQASDTTAISLSECIQTELPLQTGVSAKVTVLTKDELETILGVQPFGEVVTDFSKLMVSVLMDPKDVALLQPFENKKWTPEAFAIGTRVAYNWCPEGVLSSKGLIAMNKVLGERITARNWATLLKLKVALDQM